MGRHRRPDEHQATYREVFAVGEFRAIWLSQTLSYIGDQLAQVALAYLVYLATHSALATAATYAMTYLPPILGGPMLSALADLLPRKSLMLTCDVLRAGLVAAMAVPSVPIPVIAVLLCGTVLLGTPFTAARAALLPEILDDDRYVAGSAINNITHQATQMLGFVAGGGLVAVVNPHQALGIDAATFLLSALVISVGVKRRPAPRREGGKRASVWSVTRGGITLVFGDRVLRALIGFAWLCGFYTIPEGLAAPYAAALGGGPLTLGLLMSATPTGMVVGAFAFSRFVTPSNRLRSMGWMAILACAPLVGAAFRPPLWGTLALWAGCGLGSAYQLAANAAFVARVPPEGRGQAFGLAQSGILATQGLGILFGGAAAQILGPEPVVAMAGMAGLLVATMLALSWAQNRSAVLEEFLAPSPA